MGFEKVSKHHEKSFFEEKLPLWAKITLIVLLIILTITVRTEKTYQNDFDSYWMEGMSESIQIHKSALWVFSPFSLTGFYPLSYPSGTQFFLAFFSEVSGLDMTQSIYLSAIFLGLLITGLVFLLTFELFGSWFTAFLAACFVSLSSTLINFTSFNAGGRAFIMPFYLLLTFALIKWYKKKDFRFLFLGIFAFAFALITHRTVAFIVPIILSFILAKLYVSLPKIWSFIRDHKHYKNHVHPRYEKSKYYILFDLGLIGIFLVGLKVMDLILRGRLAYNFERLVTVKVEEFVLTEKVLLFFALGVLIILILGCVLLFLRFVKKKRPLKTFFNFFHHHYHQIFINPQKYFLHLLFIIFLSLFIGQFFGNSFYSPSYNHFKDGIVSGSNPLFIFINFLFNFSVSVSPAFVFSFLAFFVLLYVKHKKLNEWFLIFFFLSFCSLLLDKNYMRLFLVPFFAIFASYGIVYMMNKLRKHRWLIFKSGSIAFLAIVLLVVIVGSQTELIRKEINDEQFKYFTSNPSEYWETGLYINNIEGDFSTITTAEQDAGVAIFASSGVPGSSHNVYYYVDKKYLEPVPLSFSTIKEKVSNGQKIQEFWRLEDWIFGGKYYLGRHAKYLFEKEFTSKVSQRIISDYSIEYYIHDKNRDESKLLRSLEPVKNQLYDNPKAVVYDIEVGR